MNGSVYSVLKTKSSTLTTNKGEGQKIAISTNVIFDISATAANGKSHALTASYNGAIPSNSYERKQRTMLFEQLSSYVVPFDKTLQILDKEVQRGKVGFFRKDSQANRVYYIHDKAVTLCGDAGGSAAKMVPYLFGCITPDRVEKRQNGQRFNEGKKFYTLTAQDKHGILIEGYIRKLTPVECERLQTVPDNYTAGVSNCQRYKMLGNGWTVDVIACFFQGLSTKY
jgi:DNA (cytosine-5)-methyltransferase 3A